MAERSRVRRRKIENSLERELATGMIVSREVLQNVSQIWDPELIKVQFVQTIGHWCLEYFDRYDKAPGQQIEQIYQSYVRKGLEEDIADPLDDFLREISEEYEKADKLNSAYLVDRIEERFRQKALENLIEDMQADITNDDVSGAETRMLDYRRPNRQTTQGTDVFNDKEAIWAAYERATTPLFKYPGYFGRLINKQLVRGGLVFFIGRAKIGKTWELMELAFRAARARNNVAFFSIGDMEEGEMLLRIGARLTGRSHDKDYCDGMWMPVQDCKSNQDDTCDLVERTCDIGLDDAKHPDETPKGYTPCTACADCNFKKYKGAHWYKWRDPVKPLDKRDQYKAGKKFMGRFKGKQFRLFSHPNGTINSRDIEDQLNALEYYEGWVPDVVVIDYADLLDALPGDEHQKPRDQRNNNMKRLRRIGQERHCLVCSATQSDTAGQDIWMLTRKNFNEDKRLLDHVTALFSLNQNAEEKAQGVLRAGTILLRNGSFDERALATILSCREAGKPHLSSYKYIYPPKKNKKETK